MKINITLFIALFVMGNLFAGETTLFLSLQQALVELSTEVLVSEIAQLEKYISAAKEEQRLRERRKKQLIQSLKVNSSRFELELDNEIALLKECNALVGLHKGELVIMRTELKRRQSQDLPL